MFSGHWRPSPMLRTHDVAHTSLPSPHLLVADASVKVTSLLAVMVRRVFCLCVCFSPPCFVAFWDPETPQRHSCESFLLYGKTSPSQLPPQDVSIPKSFISFCLYILFYLLLKRLSCLSWSLVSSVPAFRKLFCVGLLSIQMTFDEFAGRKCLPWPFLCHFGTIFVILDCRFFLFIT